MRIKFDSAACCGNARCNAKAPEVYDLDDMGHCLPRFDDLPDDLVEAAKLGARNCPEAAIRIVKD